MTRQTIFNKPVKDSPLSKKNYELLCIILILGSGLLPRLLLVHFFPTRPFSDFLLIVNFGVLLSHDLFAKGFGGWQLLNPGLPLFLSILFRLIPADPASIARWATAIMGGIFPLIPLIVWKDIFSLRARFLSSFLLALWPGQIIFSGVVAQDNWILLPTLLLCALVVRIMVQKSNGYPFWASLLYVAALAIRQEMLVVLLPVAIPGILGLNSKKIIRNLLTGAAIMVFFVSLLVIQRGGATGNYSLSTGHYGSALLGSYVPGAGVSWIDPKPYFAATAPELLKNDIYIAKSTQFVLREISRRPVFHFIRMFSLPLSDMLLSFEGKLAYWSMTGPDALSQEYQVSANGFVNQVSQPLSWLSSIAHILFIAAVVFLFTKRKSLLIAMPLLLVILLKIGVHAVVVSQSRFYLTSIAVEFLIIGIAVNGGMLDLHNKRSTFTLLIASCLGFIMLVGLTKSGVSYISKHDENPQYHYQFPLNLGPYQFTCKMNKGRLLSFYSGINNALITMDFVDADLIPQEISRVECVGQNFPDIALQVSVSDSYANGALPARIMQFFYLDGEEIFRHDIANVAWSGKNNFVVKSTPNGELKFAFELRAIKPDKGWGWGRAAYTEIQFELINP
jgi:hypothetical protein